MPCTKTITIKIGQILLPIIGVALIIMGVQPRILAQEPFHFQGRPICPPELISPSVSISKKDFDVAKALLNSEIKPEIKTIPTDGSYSVPLSLGLDAWLEAEAVHIQCDEDDKDHNKVRITNSEASVLARALDELANRNMTKSNYAKAEELLKSAIAITKDSGRNAVDLEKYQSEYADLLRKMNSVKEAASKNALPGVLSPPESNPLTMPVGDFGPIPVYGGPNNLPDTMMQEKLYYLPAKTFNQ